VSKVGVAEVVVDGGGRVSADLDTLLIALFTDWRTIFCRAGPGAGIRPRSLRLSWCAWRVAQVLLDCASERRFAALRASAAGAPVPVSARTAGLYQAPARAGADDRRAAQHAGASVAVVVREAAAARHDADRVRGASRPPPTSVTSRADSALEPTLVARAATSVTSRAHTALEPTLVPRAVFAPRHCATFPRPDRQDERRRHDSLGQIRQSIESVFATLKGQLSLERHGAHTMPALVVRIASDHSPWPPSAGTTGNSVTPAATSSPTTTNDSQTESII
jgi:hypothetical protein